MNARFAGEASFAEEKVGVGVVAEIRPSGCLWAVSADFLQHLLSTDPIEGVLEINLEDPLVVVGDAVVVEDGIGRVYDGLRATPHANSYLKGGEIGDCVSCGLSGHAFGRPTPNSFSYGNRSMSAGFLDSGKQVATTKKRGDEGGGFAGGKKVDDPCHRGEKGVAAVGSNGSPEMGRTRGRRTSS